MNKEYIISVIEQFENAPKLPKELTSKLQTIKTNFQSISQDTFELLSNGAVRVSPEEDSAIDDNPLSELRDMYSELEKLALSGEDNGPLNRAILELRGILDIPDRYWP